MKFQATSVWEKVYVVDNQRKIQLSQEIKDVHSKTYFLHPESKV